MAEGVSTASWEGVFGGQDVLAGADLDYAVAAAGADEGPRAAMIYQHDTDEASQAIADALTERVNRHRETVSPEDPEAGSDEDSHDPVAAR